jgi:TRAP-type mannitol/chloroaromatic compound transport system substrate-binding protein
MMGFDKAADYYYTGWHEPGSILEITFNKNRWEQLSPQHQAIITTACEEMTGTMVQEFRYKNAKALQEMPENVKIKTFPKEMIDGAKVALKEVLELESNKNEDFKRVLESYNDFTKLNKNWDDISTKNFLDIRS